MTACARARDGQIRGHEILLLVDVGNVTPVRLLADDRYPVRVLGADALRLGLSTILRRVRTIFIVFDARLGEETAWGASTRAEARSARRGTTSPSLCPNSAVEVEVYQILERHRAAGRAAAVFFRQETA